MVFVKYGTRPENQILENMGNTSIYQHIIGLGYSSIIYISTILHSFRYTNVIIMNREVRNVYMQLNSVILDSNR